MTSLSPEPVPPPPPPGGALSSPLSAETPAAKQRFYVIQEILSTEHTYVARLKLTIDVVLGQLKAQNILDKKDVGLQFDGFVQIYKLHARHSLDGTTSQNLKFLSLFEDIASHCDIYSQYLVNYEPAMQRRGHLLTKNRRFSDFVATIEKDPVMQGASLESLFILPVQRIPRYRLLMEQLIKYTPETHPDHSILQNALATISLTAETNNEAIRARENKEKILQIMLQIEPTTRVDLLEDINRRFVMEATLLRQCRKRYKEFQFWLFTDQLCYGEKAPLGLYTLNRQIFLNKCYIQTDFPSSESDHQDAFIVMSPAKTFKVKTKSAAEKQEWVTAINSYIQKSSAAAEGGSSVDVAGIAPLWKPDGHSPDCELCHAVFTLLFRRHHCRHCGRVVCDQCSAKRFHLPHVELRRLVRVCDRCFPLLQQQQQNTNNICNNGNSKDNIDLTGQSKRPGIFAQSSVRTDIASDEEEQEYGDSDEDGEDGENSNSDDERSRGEVDDAALDDFNDWEIAQRAAGTLPTPNNHNLFENERIATLVTAPMMKMSAVLGDNIRRFARSSITLPSAVGGATNPTPLSSSPSQNRWIPRSLSPLRSAPSAASSSTNTNATNKNGNQNNSHNVSLSAAPMTSVSNPVLHSNQEFVSGIFSSSSTVQPPHTPPPIPPPRRYSHLHPSNIPTHPSTVHTSLDATNQNSNNSNNNGSSSTGANNNVSNSGNSNNSNPPPKPQRVQRRTNVVIHIDPASVAAAAARIAEEEATS